MRRGLLCACVSLLPGCGLTSALSYPSADDGDASNVVARGEVAYAALCERGLGVVELASGTLVKVLPPPRGSERVDDLALADGLLFTLDADEGALAIWSLADARAPVTVAGPVAVPVGPFSGISAGGGLVVVSGGTDVLTVRGYDAQGQLTTAPATIEVARGQPDVLIAPDGRYAYVSTHFESTLFGLTVLDLTERPGPLPRVAGKLVLEDAGFSEGGTKPANFPLVAALRRDRLYLAFGGGLAVVDVRDPEAPALVTVLPLGMQAVHIAIDRDQAAIVGDKPATLAIVSLADADAPALVRKEALPSRTTGVALTGAHVALAAGRRGVVVVAR